MMRFLTEQDMPAAVRLMLAEAEEAVLAVAFWGTGATELLGLDQFCASRSIKVVCNLDSGACNPDEIVKLQKLKIDVRSNSRLHGKVYWTPKQLILGSSNASTNGLVDDVDTHGWFEANLQIEQSEMIDTIGAWCQTLIGGAAQITDLQLAKAREVWNRRREMLPAYAGLSSDLIECLKRHPDNPAFEKVKLLVWRDPGTEKGQSQHHEIAKASPAFAKMEVYEDWGKEIVENDWIIDIPRNGDPVRIFRILGGYPSNNLHAAEKVSTICLDSFGSLDLADAAKKRLVKHMRVGSFKPNDLISLANLYRDAPELFAKA